MNKTRRSFLRGGTEILKDRRDRRPKQAPTPLNAGDLSPYTPRPGKEWDERRAAHLLRRTGFGVTIQDIRTALASTPQALVTAMLQPGTMPAVPTDMSATAPADRDWTSRLQRPLDNSEVSFHYQRIRDLQEWWLKASLNTANMLREKMVLFWHNHFTSEFLVVYYAQLMYIQNQLYRQNAFGSFLDLTKAVTVDPAMLIYLNGNASIAGKPNENYGRELLELFTLGAGAYADGTPHYTERDIIEMARALTGWRDGYNTQSLNSFFTPGRFDNNDKTLLGQTGNFGVQGKAPMDVIDLIFAQVDKDLNRKRAAVYLCTKLYHYFVYDGQAPDNIIAAMAQTLEQNNWNVGAVLAQLLTSEHFFDDDVMGAKIKSPVEFTLGAMRSFGLTNPTKGPWAGDTTSTRNYTSTSQPETHDPLTVMTYLSQVYFAPPNVKGWIGGRTWISGATTPLRIRYVKFWVEPVPNQTVSYGFDPVNYVMGLMTAEEQMKTPAERVHLIVDRLAVIHLPLSISTNTKNTLLDILLGGAPDYEWDETKAVAKIRACMVKISQLAEYQLM